MTRAHPPPNVDPLILSSAFPSRSLALLPPTLARINMCRTSRIQSLLLAEASNSDLLHRHAAAIVSGGKIVALGHNTKRTSFGGGIQRTSTPYSHCLLLWS
jgi:hypothetical protein